MGRLAGNSGAGLALVAAGCAATLAQVAVLRELIVLGAGSELAAGLSLAAWLLFTGAGAALGSRINTSQGTLAVLLALVAPLIPAAVLLVRLARTLLPVPAGEIVSLPLVLAAALSAAPFCLLAGAVFPVALASSRLAVAAAYALEAAGAVAGGLAFIVLAGRLGQLELALAAATLLLAAALLVAASRPALVAAALVSALTLGLWLERAALEERSRAWQWPGWRILASLDSPYGNLTAARTLQAASQVDLFTSGLWAFSCPDEEEAEQVLLPLLAHPEPRRLLCLGLPPPLALEKLLAHPQVREVACIELDAALPRLLRASLPEAGAAVLDDPRLALHVADPRQWVAAAPAHSFDIVLLLAPEPRTAALSRLWSAEFFGRLARLLASGGLIAFRVAAAPQALGPLEADYLACLARSAGAAGKVSLLPAHQLTFVVSPEGRAPEPARMARRIEQLGLKTRFVTPHLVRHELEPLRIAYLEAALAESGAAANTDLSPRCFYFNTVLWSSQHEAWLPSLHTGLTSLPEGALRWGLALLPLLSAVLLAGRRRRRSAALLALAYVGFATMAAQVALLILFQVAHGSLYLQLALLVAAFMAGLGAGAALAARSSLPQAGLPVLALTLLAAATALGATALLSAPAWAFAALSALFGLAAGHAFPALALALTSGGRGPSAAGVAYGAELAGSGAGCVLASLVIVPLAGLSATLWAAAAAGLSATLAATFARPRMRLLP